MFELLYALKILLSKNTEILIKITIHKITVMLFAKGSTSSQDIF